MAGRFDDAAHMAATARISEAAKHTDELRQHLDEILNGPAFKGSQRSQKFLQYIVDRALLGQFEDLRERNIGKELFGRSAGYDTAEDAIVRVTASDVRKRLHQHYKNAEASSGFMIDVPSGSYVPGFRYASSSASVVPNGSSTAQQSAEETTADKILPTGGQVPPVGSRLHFSWRVLALLSLAALVASTTWQLVGSRFWGGPAPGSNFISAAFGDAPADILVIVGDDGLLLIEALLRQRFTLQEYENRKFLNTPELVAKKDLQGFWEILSSRQMTNAAYLQNLSRIVKAMREQNRNVSVRHARQINARDLRNGNFIFLGSSHAIPWATLFAVHDSNFEFEAVRGEKWALIRNRKPLAGEPADFEVHVDEKTGKTVSFALVSLVENNSRTGRALLLAGQTTSATELAGDFLLRSDAVATAFRMLKLPASSRLPDLEMVLRVTEANDVGDSVTLIACRKLTSRPD
jgi:hypothetical protein